MFVLCVLVERFRATGQLSDRHPEMVSANYTPSCSRRLKFVYFFLAGLVSVAVIIGGVRCDRRLGPCGQRNSLRVVAGVGLYGGTAASRHGIP
jgi:hypothetical protein